MIGTRQTLSAILSFYPEGWRPPSPPPLLSPPKKLCLQRAKTKHAPFIQRLQRPPQLLSLNASVYINLDALALTGGRGGGRGRSRSRRGGGGLLLRGGCGGGRRLGLLLRLHGWRRLGGDRGDVRGREERLREQAAQAHRGHRAEGLEGTLVRGREALHLWQWPGDGGGEGRGGVEGGAQSPVFFPYQLGVRSSRLASLGNSGRVFSLHVTSSPNLRPDGVTRRNPGGRVHQY